jgi:DNA-binding XRE family transcriptional regulator
MSTKYGLKELESEFGELTFGRILKSHRLGEEMSQVEMAKHLKISKQSLNDLESGRAIPSIARAVEIAKRIGLMAATLVELAIQDQLRREKLDMTVKIDEGKAKKKAVGF